ncbi:MAG: twin-arginine translocation signal domain-containing protein, partial [Sphingomicrobium sp.]
MDRRSFLKAGGATAAIVPFATGAAAQTSPGTAAAGDAKLN